MNDSVVRATFGHMEYHKKTVFQYLERNMIKIAIFMVLLCFIDKDFRAMSANAGSSYTNPFRLILFTKATSSNKYIPYSKLIPHVSFGKFF